MIFLLPLRPHHLHLPSHLCLPARPAESRRPWGLSGVGQGRWGAPGSLLPSNRRKSRVRRGPAWGGMGSPASALRGSARSPPAPPPAATFGGGGGSRLAEEGGGLLGLGSSGSEQNPLLRPAQCPQLGKSRNAPHWEAGERTVGRLRHVPGIPRSPENARREVPLRWRDLGEGALVRGND